MIDNRLISAQEVAKFLNVHQMTIYRWLKSNHLPGFKVGGVWRFRREDLNKYLETNMRLK